MNTGILRAIKIGDTRVVLNNITNIEDRLSQHIQQRKDGTFFENWDGKDEDKTPGRVVTVYFVSSGETPDYVRFFKEDARNFLAEFDAYMGVKE